MSGEKWLSSINMKKISLEILLKGKTHETEKNVIEEDDWF